MAAPSRYRIKQPLDPWTTREKLALACSVLRSGDQNWMSVSRTVRPLGEPDRAEQWYSQRNCAQQYTELLETVETPKRKRGEKEKESAETAQLVIARKLTLERVEELRDVIKRQQDEYQKLREEIEQINAGHFDKDLQELVAKIKEEEHVEKKEIVKEEKGDGDASITPSAPLTVTPVTEVKVKIEKEDTSMETEDISVVEETVITDITPIVPEPEPKQEPVPEEPVIPKPETPVKQIKQESKESTPVKPQIQEEKIAIIKTEPDDVEVDILVTETSDEGPHMVADTTVVEEEKVVEVEVEAEVTVKEEPEEVSKEEQVVDVEETESVDTISIPERVPTSKDVDDNPPQSPASSIASHEPDFSSARKDYSKKGKSNRGRKPGRSSRKQEKKEERPLPSELDTSDDDEKSVSSKLNYLDQSQSPASITQDESDMDEKQYKLWKKSIILVWRSAANHKFDELRRRFAEYCKLFLQPVSEKNAPGYKKVIKRYAKLFLHPVTESIAPGYSSIVFRYANVFMHPVKEDIAPGYKKIVLRPMDLQSIKRKIEAGEIRSTVDFQRDIMLMFTNAMMYNNQDHDVYKMAMDMYNDVMNSIEQYVSTQVVWPSEGTPTGKILRQSRRSENTALSGSERSDKEDDIKKRRQSVDEGGKVKKRKT